MALILAGAVIRPRSVLIGRKRSSSPDSNRDVAIGHDTRNPSSPDFIGTREGLPDLELPAGVQGSAETVKALTHSLGSTLDGEDAWATKVQCRGAIGNANDVEGGNEARDPLKLRRSSDDDPVSPHER